jgi:hypothetical protein
MLIEKNEGKVSDFMEHNIAYIGFLSTRLLKERNFHVLVFYVVC